MFSRIFFNYEFLLKLSEFFLFILYSIVNVNNKIHYRGENSYSLGVTELMKTIWWADQYVEIKVRELVDP